MNRKNFLKNCLALCGLGALTADATETKPIKEQTPNIITTKQLHVTDGNDTYTLVVRNGTLMIEKLKIEEEPLLENLNVENRLFQITKPKAVVFDL
jgi:hypothetical protein